MQAASGGKSSMDPLFHSERIIFARAKDNIQNPEYKDNPLLSEYKKLAVHYYELCDEYSKMIKLSDQQQIQLKKANNDLHKLNQKHFNLSRKLSRYISYQIIDSILKGNQAPSLTSKRKQITIYFSDIVNFTKFTDNMEPKVICKFLNSYFHEMAIIAMKYGATIDKFMGDAIMIFFGDPESLGVNEDAYACVSMAIEMNNRIKKLQNEWENDGIANKIETRTGITTGYCAVGNFGCDLLLDYTIIGRDVNLASRIESHADPGEILISETTYSLLKERIKCQKKDLINIKGIAKPVQVYSLTGLQETGLF